MLIRLNDITLQFSNKVSVKYHSESKVEISILLVHSFSPTLGYMTDKKAKRKTKLFQLERLDTDTVQ